MPPKIGELERLLKRKYFTNRGGRGSHRNYEHPTGVTVGISGQPGHDAKRYQEKEVREAIEEAEKRSKK